MNGKTWVYLCSGCGIGESLDLEGLRSTLEEEYDLAGCEIHPFLCGAEGCQKVCGDIASEPACNLVLGACSPRVNTDVFSFGAETVLERVNLREHVAWSHAPNDEDTQMLAADSMRMGIVKAQKSQPLQPAVPESCSQAILVVGGGVAGLTAALKCAQAGHEVVVVEKESELGGHMAQWHRETPKAPPFRDPRPPRVNALMEAVKSHPRIRVYCSAEIEAIAGAPGMFDVSIKQNGASAQMKIGAIILAAGWKSYDPSRLTHLGHGLANVVTQENLEQMAREGAIVRPSDGKPPKRVAFIQCAGSRDPNHLAYCSSVCCMTSLKQALYVRERDPEAQVYIFYKDMRTPGQYEDFYRRVQEDGGVCLTKGDVKSISEDDDKTLTIEVENTLLGENIRLKADLAVLAVGMTPATLDQGILRLKYRLGEDAPVNKYGFPNSDFICFPYETRRTGIYAAGCVRQPMDAAAAEADATGAALKAIQCVALTARGAAVHPRAVDLSFPDFFLQRCTQCKRCTEECPFGALDEDVKGTPLPNLTRCRRCGICMGACPERIINFANYSIDMIASVIKAVQVPDEFEEKPRILVFACENDAYPAFDLAGMRRHTYNPHARIIPVRCLGSVNIVWIADALSRGFDGILMIGCKYGDDYQCHMIKGSELLNRRSENVQETLTRLSLEPERVRLEQLALSDYDRIPALINEFVGTIEEIGPNPFKGM